MYSDALRRPFCAFFISYSTLSLLELSHFTNKVWIVMRIKYVELFLGQVVSEGPDIAWCVLELFVVFEQVNHLFIILFVFYYYLGKNV